MNTEVYNLIDTAIKIGLGAIITGLSAFILSNNNFKNETQKKINESRKGLLLDAAIKIEKANYKFEESDHPLWEHVV